MQRYGKALGRILGLIIARGSVGTALGVLLAHLFAERDNAFYRRNGGAASDQFSRLFLDVAFEVMGHLAKIDGRVSEEEIRAARAIMNDLKFTPEQVSGAIERFTHGKSEGYPLARRLDALGRQIGHRDELARAFVHLQLEYALGAGPIGPEKRQLLWYVANALYLSRAELVRLESRARAQRERAARRGGSPSIEDAYRVLGVASDASDDEVKKAYRRLMNRHHPDKLVARGLPESIDGTAEQKTHEVRAAYERIKARRGFK